MFSLVHRLKNLFLSGKTVSGTCLLKRTPGVQRYFGVLQACHIQLDRLSSRMKNRYKVYRSLSHSSLCLVGASSSSSSSSSDVSSAYISSSEES